MEKKSDQKKEAEKKGSEKAEEEKSVEKKIGKKKEPVRRRKKEKKESDIMKAVRLAVESGRVKYGTNNALKDSLLGSSKLFLISSNCPKETTEAIAYYSSFSKIPTYTFPGTSLELGTVCGKPFPVSVLSVQDAGNSNILDLIKKKEK